MLGDVSPAEFIRRAQALRSDRALGERLVAAANAGEADYPPSPHVERQIYDGFWSDADARKLEAFHRARWEERVRIADDLEDPRLVWLARRLIFVERPHLLAPELHVGMATEKARRMMADSGGWTTLAKAAGDLAAMLPDMDAELAAPFLRLGAYLGSRADQAERVLSG